MSNSSPTKSQKNNQEMQLSPGKYILQILIEETRSLTKRNLMEDETFNVMIKVTGLGSSKYTSKKTGVGYGSATDYGEHFFFQKKFQIESEIMGSVANIEVFSITTLSKQLIGSLDISIPLIYYEPDHTFRHRWMGLSNIDLDYQKIMGYVKLSATICKEDETRQVLQAEDLGSRMEDSSIKQLRLNPQFKVQNKIMRILIFEVRRLAGFDPFNRGDIPTKASKELRKTKRAVREIKYQPFLKVNLGGTELSTLTQDLTNKIDCVIINQRIDLSLLYPTHVHSLKVTLIDAAGLYPDRVLGTKRFNVQDIEKGKFRFPFWAYFYGARNKTVDVNVRDQMNMFSEIAPVFNGSVYMAIYLTDDAVKKKDDTTLPIFVQRRAAKQRVVSLDTSATARPPPLVKFFVKIGVYSVQNLSTLRRLMTGMCYIEINWGNSVLRTHDMKFDSNKGMVKFYECLAGEVKFSVGLNKKIKNKKKRSLEILRTLPDVTISLVHSRKGHVCFCRVRPEEYLDTDNPKEHYFLMNKDQSVTDDLTEDSTGIFHFKMTISDLKKSVASEINERPSFMDITQEPKISRKISIVIYLFQAKRLAAKDAEGSSDAYIEAYHYGNKARSSICFKTLNPIWNERIILESYIVGSFLAPLILNVYDYDDDGSSDYLGSTSIILGPDHLERDINKVPKAHWYNVRYSKDLVLGKISASFSILDHLAPDEESRHGEVMALKNDKEDYLLKIKMLGLRNLKGIGGKDVKKPYLHMLTGEIKHDSVKKDNTRNQTINDDFINIYEEAEGTKIMNLPVTISIKDSIKPNIICRVMDKHFFFKDSIIGHFEIDLGYFSTLSKLLMIERLNRLITHLKLKFEKEEEIRKLEAIVRELKRETKEVLSFNIKQFKKKTDVQKFVEKNPDLVVMDKSHNSSNEYEEIKMLNAKTTGVKNINGLKKLKAVLKLIKMANHDNILISKKDGQDVENIELDEEEIAYKQKMEKRYDQTFKPSKKELDIRKKETELLKKSNPGLEDPENQPGERTITLQDFEQKEEESEEEQSSERGPVQLSNMEMLSKIRGTQVVESGRQSVGMNQFASNQRNRRKNNRTTSIVKMATKKRSPGKSRKGSDSTPMKKKKTFRNALKVVILPKYEIDKKLQKKLRKRAIVENSQLNFYKTEDEQAVLVVNQSKKQQTKKFDPLEREVDIPNLKKYRGVGYDSATKRNKHYRLQLNCELNQMMEGSKSEFEAIKVLRGQSVNKKDNFFQSLFYPTEVYNSVGIFRGGVSLISTRLLGRLKELDCDEEYEKFDIPYDQKSWETRRIDVEMMRCIELKVRAYVLDAKLYHSADQNSLSDPYIVVKLGNKVEYNGKKVAITDQMNPIFNKLVEINCRIPGQGTLIIQVWDEDIIKDELIGETAIDIEERFFDEGYRHMKEQPIERRKLYLPGTQQEVGFLNCWVDIFRNVSKRDVFFQKNRLRKQPRLWDISSIPAQEYELRVVIWEVKDVPLVDIVGTTDIFVKGIVSCGEKNLEDKTDVHKNSSNGYGSFNWRMVFPIQIDEYSCMPDNRGKFRLELQIWDDDFLNGSDFISSTTIPFWDLVEKAMRTERKVSKFKKEGFFTKKKNYRFNIKTKPNPTLNNPAFIRESKIRISVDLIPKEVADKNPVGKGRGDPNQDPYLPRPVGRESFTLDPMTILTRRLGPVDRRIVGAAAASLFCFCCICMIFSVVIGIFISKSIGII